MEPNQQEDELKYWKRALKEYLDIIRPYRARMIRMVFVVVAIQTLAIIEPSIIMSMLNEVVKHPERARQTLPYLVVASAVALALLTIIKVKQFASARGIESDLERDLPIACMDKLLALPLSYHQNENAGRVVGKITRGVGRIVDLTWNVTFEFIPVLIMTLFTIAVLAVVNVWYGAGIFVVFILYAFMLIWARRRGRAHYLARHAIYERMDEHLGEVASNVLTVQSFSQELRMIEENRVQRFRAREIVEVEFGGYDTVAAWRGMLSNATRVIVIASASYGALSGRYSFGAIAFLAMLVERFFNNLFHLSGVYDRFVECLDPLHRITTLLEAPVRVADPVAPRELVGPVSGSITFHDVRFQYPTESTEPPSWALDGVNLQIMPGETIGIAGQSGNGKSTLINLLLRTDDPTEGSVRIDGVDLRTMRKSDFRSLIGYVPQDVQVFDATVEENIRFGKPDATHDEVVRAARIAGAEEFILHKLPQGYATRVGTNGSKLSGGQCQRIGIARAIIRHPRILVFDEATSSIDPISIEKIMRSLEALRGKCTILLISHQLSTLQRLADRIVVMKEGKIAEIGTHAELLHANGLYHTLASIQQHAEEAA